MASNYFELLKHPNWQKKRLEVMQRAGFKCEMCGSAESTLNVHHRHYEKGKKPWEYDDAVFQCLCEDCHQVVTEFTQSTLRFFGALNNVNMAIVHGYVAAILHLQGEGEDIYAAKCKLYEGLPEADKPWKIGANDALSHECLEPRKGETAA